MGERKGTNKYYPPDYDPKKGGLNKFLGTHALRERARKIHLGIIIIRFEMPYNIWCEGCNNHIGMGVRYNAEKTKIGMYFSTPVYQFRMKCHLCDNHFEIKTDPGNFDYVIVSGARRQENRWDPLENEQVVPETLEVQKRLFDDPMYKLEHELKDKQAADTTKPVLEKLYERNLDLWKDNYEANCRLRASFREKRKEIKQQQDKDRELLAKSSLEINLLPETDKDRQMATLMKLQSKSAQEREEERRLDILIKPALPSATTTSFGGLKRQKLLTTKLSSADLGIKRKKSNSVADTVKQSCRVSDEEKQGTQNTFKTAESIIMNGKPSAMSSGFLDLETHAVSADSIRSENSALTTLATSVNSETSATSANSLNSEKPLASTFSGAPATLRGLSLVEDYSSSDDTS